jgi:hypothetical protein
LIQNSATIAITTTIKNGLFFVIDPPGELIPVADDELAEACPISLAREDECDDDDESDSSQGNHVAADPLAAEDV